MEIPVFIRGPCEEIYIVQAGDQPYVKIGKTRRLKRRLLVLQEGTPDLLHVLATFHGVEEREVHAVFMSCHVRGEWFYFTPEIQWLVDLAQVKRVGPIHAYLKLLQEKQRKEALRQAGLKVTPPKRLLHLVKLKASDEILKISN